MDWVDPPRIPDQMQPWYSPQEVERLLKSIGRTKTPNDHRDTAVVLTLYDSGLRAAELCSLRKDNMEWRQRTLRVIGKNDKERRVAIGYRAATAIERYLRRRAGDSPWLFASRGGGPMAINGLRMLLARRFKEASIPFRGIHAFRRGWASSYLENGGDPGDLRILGGWSGFGMVARYARGTEADRALRGRAKASPGDRLNVR